MIYDNITTYDEEIEGHSKKCKRCGMIYTLDFFYIVHERARNRRYRRGHCCFCDNKMSRANYKKNRHKILAKKKATYKNDPWVIRANGLMKRCKIGFIKPQDLKDLIVKANNRCEYCHKTLDGDLTFDHAQPISKGGSNDLDNLRVACLSCNSKKSDKTEAQFRLQETGVPF